MGSFQTAIGKEKKEQMPKRKRKRKKETDRSKDINVKYMGVAKSGQRFQASIYTDGKRHYLGAFNTPKEAAVAYDRAGIEAGRPISKLNFLDQVPKNYKPKKKKLRSTNTIGYRGVYKRRKRFIAMITISGKQQSVGTFGTIKEAAIAYDLAAIAHYPTSFLNFPEMIHVKKIKNPKVRVKYKGVDKIRERFRARIKIDGKDHGLGMFDTSREAAEASDRAHIQAGHPTSKLNFLDQVPKSYKVKKKKLGPQNTTGFRGVIKKGNRFLARFKIGGISQHIGSFGTARDAAAAYDMAIVELSGKSIDELKSLLNFPNGLEEEVEVAEEEL